MNVNPSTDLFEIKLSEEGIRFAKKLLRIFKLVVWIGILISAISIVSGIYYMLRIPFDYSSLTYWQRLYFKIFPYYQCFHSLLFLVQIYFYWKFNNQLSFAINYNNKRNFTEAFRFLFKNAVWAILTMGAALIFSIFDFVYMLSFRY